MNKYSAAVNEHQIILLCKFNANLDETVLFRHRLACTAVLFRNELKHNYFPTKLLLAVPLIGLRKYLNPM